MHIHAQRELAFEVVSALGVGGAVNGSGGNAGESPMSVVLKTDGPRMLVEFNTPLKLGPFATTWKSTEWVTPEKPRSIDFELVPASGIISGGLRQLTDRFEFAPEGNCTILTYSSRFGIRWSVGGWLVGKVLVAPIMNMHMSEHLVQVKEMVESRARRSRVYPQLDCPENNEAAQGSNPGEGNS